MCSADNDDRRPGLCEPIGENLTIDPFDTVVWDPDDPAFSPSTTDPDHSIPASIPIAARSGKHRPSLSTDYGTSEGEDTLKEHIYLPNLPNDFSTSVARSECLSELGAVGPPSLTHEYSSSSNPDVGNYTHNPATPIVPGCGPTGTVETEGTARPEAMEPRTADKSGGGDGSGSTRTLSHRERNRIAAHKCRQKNKLNIQALQEQERHLAEQNRFLSEHAHLLKNEVLGLRTEILNHGNCDDELIQNYIAETAKKLQQ